MAGIGRVSVTSATANGYNKYDVTVKFEIAFDWGGYNAEGASYSIQCAGQTATGTATFNVGSGGGSWVYATIATKTFTVTMDKSGSSKKISISGYINTGVTPATISADGTYTLAARTWQWTVSYNANGGSGAPSSQTKTYGADLKLSTTKPTRTGYTFQGWATSESSTTVAYAAGATYTSNKALTLYAVWKANTYAVSYNANGGSGAPSSQTKTYGVSLTLSNTKPTRTNYNFLGWGTSKSSTTVAYAAGATYAKNAAITLYAIWELAYTKPRITGVTVDRCTSDGTLSDEGTYGLVAFDWATDKAVSSIKIEHKLSTASSWISPADTVFPSDTELESNTSGSVSWVIGNNTLDTENEYNVRITVADASGSNNVSRNIPTLAYIIDLLKGGKGIAFGKVAKKEGYMEVSLIAEFLKNVLVRNGNTEYNVAEELAKIAGKQDNLTKTATTETDFNNIKIPGNYWINPTVTTENHPYSGRYGVLEVLRNGVMQRFTAYYNGTASANGKVYVRFYANSAWTAWSEQGKAYLHKAATDKTVSVSSGTISSAYGTYTPVRGGVALISVKAFFAKSTSSTRKVIIVRLNDDATTGNELCQYEVTGTSSTMVNGTFMIQLAAGDKVTAHLYQNSGSAMSVTKCNLHVNML